MSCSSCGKGFSLLKKELSCPVCGFVYCKNCCSKKLVVENSGIDKPQTVCNSCHHKLTSGKKSTGPPSPPANFKKRLQFASRTMSTEDQVLEAKLAQLKDDQKGPVATEEEIGVRLAHLKNLDTKHFVSPHTLIYKAPDLRTEAEKAQDLMVQLQKEAELDSRQTKPEDEIEHRLNKLRKDWPLKDKPLGKLNGLEGGSSSGDPVINQTDLNKEELTEDKEVKKLMQKFLEEAALTESTSEENLESILPKETKADEVLPWCVICNEDAQLSCSGCSNDLYCKSCYKEFHDNEDFDEDHKASPYKS